MVFVGLIKVYKFRKIKSQLDLIFLGAVVVALVTDRDYGERRLIKTLA
jgi:hypothetical protein